MAQLPAKPCLLCPVPEAGLSLCRYLHKPYLISGSKFDLRIYVYVTSYDPLRIYLFSDGLVRFASCKYVVVVGARPNSLGDLFSLQGGKLVDSEQESNHCFGSFC